MGESIEMRNIRTEQEIMQHWKGGTTAPLVSICCITYNHEPYIEDALEGFLIQRTDFPFEILIHDDASTDRTADIVREYKSEYPTIIKTLCQTENQYSRGEKPNLIAMQMASGKYLAICEGDDYWTDPQKLQIQVSFLENNPGFVLSGHDAFDIDEHGNRISDSVLSATYKRDASSEDLIYGRARFATMTMVYRNVLAAEAIPERRMIVSGDLFATSLLGNYGKGKYHHEIAPAAYRRHSGGIWSMQPEKIKRDNGLNSEFWIYRYYDRVGQKAVATAWLNRWECIAIKRMSYRNICKNVGKRMISQMIIMITKIAMKSGYGKRLKEWLGESRVQKIKTILGP
ncbi:glycosyltransferase [bacterium]|nr:glycosyltransferase [bacterium]